MTVVRRARMFYCKTIFLNSSTPKMFVSAQSALEQKKKDQKSHQVHLTQIAFEALCEYE